MTDSFRSGSTETKGCRVDRVLRVSTLHMPDLHEDLSIWDWGTWSPAGRGWEMAWFFCYEEDPDLAKPIPKWLLEMCIAARDTYGCNWIVLDPEGDIIPELSTYNHD